jgi:hypothetical protein
MKSLLGEMRFFVVRDARRGLSGALAIAALGWPAGAATVQTIETIDGFHASTPLSPFDARPATFVSPHVPAAIPRHALPTAQAIPTKYLFWIVEWCSS